MSATPADIRSHLANLLARLSDKNVRGEELTAAIEAGKVASQVTNAYTGVLRAEIDAAQTLSDTGLIPAGLGRMTQYNLGTGKAMRFIGNEEQQG